MLTMPWKTFIEKMRKGKNIEFVLLLLPSDHLSVLMVNFGVSPQRRVELFDWSD